MDGRQVEAVEIALEGLALLAQTDVWARPIRLARAAAWPVADLGVVARATGDGEAAGAARERMDHVVQVVHDGRIELGNPDGRLGDVLAAEVAHVEAEQQRLEAAATADGWQSLADTWNRLGQPYPSSYALWRGAHTAVANDRETAVSMLRAAHEIASRLGAKPLMTQLDTLARKLRVRLTGHTKGDESGNVAAFGPTARELEVLGRVAAGRTNRQIAEELFISESTAGVHVSNILGKLGVSSRTEAANVALTQGLTEA